MTIQTDVSTKGWGAHFKGISTGGKWSKKEQGHHINVLELMAVKFWNPDFHKKSLEFNYSYSDGQQSCPIVSLESMGCTQSGVLKISKSILALSAVSWDHNYCRIFTK